jgi:hypothetical protein
MHENMRFNAGPMEKVVCIKKNNIFTRICLETFDRGEALTAIVISRSIVVPGYSFNIGALIRRSIIDDNALDVRVGLFKNGIHSLFEEATNRASLKISALP